MLFEMPRQTLTKHLFSDIFAIQIDRGNPSPVAIILLQLQPDGLFADEREKVQCGHIAIKLPPLRRVDAVTPGLPFSTKRPSKVSPSMFLLTFR